MTVYPLLWVLLGVIVGLVLAKALTSSQQAIDQWFSGDQFAKPQVGLALGWFTLALVILLVGLTALSI